MVGHAYTLRAELIEPLKNVGKVWSGVADRCTKDTSWLRQTTLINESIFLGYACFCVVKSVCAENLILINAFLFAVTSLTRNIHFMC